MNIKNYLAFSIIVLLLSCNKDKIIGTPSGSTAATPIPTPVIQKDSLGNLLKKEVIILTEGISLENSPTSVTIKSSVSEANKIKIGDILSSGITSSSPTGFLKKVVAKSVENGNIVLQTEQANLTDLYEEANINYEKTFTNNDVKQFRINGFELRNSRQNNVSINYEVNKVLKDLDNDLKTTNDQVKLTGALSFTPKFRFVFQKEKGLSPKNVYLGFDVIDNSKLKLDVGSEFKVKIPIISLNLGVTPIPGTLIVMKHKFILKVNAQIEAKLENIVELNSNSSFSIGIKEQLKPFVELKPDISLSSFKNIELNGEIKIGVFNPSIESTPYGIDLIKAYLEFDSGVKASLNFSKNPNWSVRKYAFGKVGIKTELQKFLGFIGDIDLNIETKDFFENDPPFLQGNYDKIVLQIKSLEGEDTFTKGMFGKEYTFVADGTYKPTAKSIYTWNFGDGSKDIKVTGNNQVKYSYKAKGTYTITMTLADEKGELTKITRQAIIKDELPTIPSDLTKMVNSEFITYLKSKGMFINEGSNPNKISGEFNLNPNVLVNNLNFTAPDYAIGERFKSYNLNFGNHDLNKKTIDVGLLRIENYIINEQHYNVGESYVIGNGNKFTIFHKNYVVLATPYYMNLSALNIYSGELKDGGIANLMHAFILLDKQYGEQTGVDRNAGRILKDEDGFSSTKIEGWKLFLPFIYLKQ